MVETDTAAGPVGQGAVQGDHTSGITTVSQHLGMARPQHMQEKSLELQSITNISFSIAGTNHVGLDPGEIPRPPEADER